MMKSIDQFLNRTKNKDYTCFHFAREVWLYLCGEDMKERLDGLAAAILNRRIPPHALAGFQLLKVPRNPCFVLMQRFRLTPHVGIYYNGRILHLTANGVEYQPLQVAKGSFQTIRYYR